MVFCVTQRQAESGEQNEIAAFLCENCHKQLFEYQFGTGVSASESELGSVLPILPTIASTEEAAAQFNKTDRTCSSCGHVSDPFPKHRWGWADHIRRTEICEQAYKSFVEQSAKS